jgi:hypothetical protein
MNREIIIPGGVGVYPLTGDVTSQAGNAPVKVTGLQGISIAVVELDGGEALQYNTNERQWVPTLRAAIQVDNVTVSDDYIVTVNLPKPILVNGV